MPEEYKFKKNAHGVWYCEKYIEGKLYNVIMLYFPGKWDRETVENNFKILRMFITGDENL